MSNKIKIGSVVKSTKGGQARFKVREFCDIAGEAMIRISEVDSSGKMRRSQMCLPPECLEMA